jgi:hypothetical protein
MADHEHFSRIINLTIDLPLDAFDLLVRMPSQDRLDSGSG